MTPFSRMERSLSMSSKRESSFHAKENLSPIFLLLSNFSLTLNSELLTLMVNHLRKSSTFDSHSINFLVRPIEFFRSSGPTWFFSILCMRKRLIFDFFIHALNYHFCFYVAKKTDKEHKTHSNMNTRWFFFNFSTNSRLLLSAFLIYSLWNNFYNLHEKSLKASAQTILSKDCTLRTTIQLKSG